MPYIIKKGKGKKPWMIVKKSTGKVVGHSATRAQAARSIGYREEGEKKSS
jgi:hypothetical protein